MSNAVAATLVPGDAADGAISFAEESDDWTFVAAANDRIVLRVSELDDTGGVFTPSLKLLSPSQSVLGSAFGTVDELAVTLGSAGTYTVRVSDGDSGVSDDLSGTGTYRLRLFQVPGATGFALPNGGSSDQSIGDPGGLNVWTFPATANDRIVLRISELTDTGSVFTPLLRLYAPNGSLLGSAFGVVDELAVVAAYTGTYTVLVSDGDSGVSDDLSGTGTYRLRLFQVPGATGFALPNGGSSDQSIGDPGGLNVWTFPATANDRIVLRISELTDTGSVFTPLLRLYAPNGSLLGSAFGVVDELAVVAAYTGTYTVLVSDGDSGVSDDLAGTGTYRLELSGTSTCTAAMDTDLDGVKDTKVAGDCFPCTSTQQSDCLDNCPSVSNPSQADIDHDGIGDACDTCSACNVCSTWGDDLCRSSPGCEAGFCNPFLNKCECVSADTGVIYAALGDSYSSGEGSEDYLEGTEIGDGNGCHRSIHGYPHLLELAGRGGKTLSELSMETDSGYDMGFVACSGALSKNMTYAAGFDDGEEFNGESIQVWAIKTDAGLDPDLVTLTLGGNDVGFAKILENCVFKFDCENEPPPKELPHRESHPTLKEWIPAALAAKVPEWTKRLLALRHEFPSASIFVMGYPRLVSGNDCPAVRLGGGDFLTLNLRLDVFEQQEIRNWAGLLNEAISQAAEEAGVHFVPVADYFKYHEVCSLFRRDWIHGISELDYTVGKACRECFHPKRRGYQEYAKAFSQYVADKRSKPWAPGFTSAGLPRNQPLPGAAAPSLQRGEVDTFGHLGDLQVDPSPRGDCGQLSAIFPGGGARLRGEGFAASSPVEVHIADATGDLFESVDAADPQGTIDVEVVVPINLAVPAFVEFRVTGVSAQGSAVVLLGYRLTTPKPEDTADSDGDGLSDVCDPCPEDIGDETDTDEDGLGDDCDPCPLDPENDSDFDGKCSDEDPCPYDFADDQDLDGVCDGTDNCPLVSNPGQEDVRQNDVGDACDPCPDEAPGACPVEKQACGDLNASGGLTASDALGILRAAVGGSQCIAEPCLCDVDGSGKVAASDALAVLRGAVGQAPPSLCPCD